MGMGDCLRCIKYLLFVFNLIFCLIGLAVLALGVWMYLKPMSFNASIDVHVSGYSGIFYIVVGAIITVLGFLGCCGAIFENRCLLVLFFILLLLVFLVLVAGGIAALFTKHLFSDAFETHFTSHVKNQNSSYSKNQTDSIQSQLNCCGAKYAEKDYTYQNLSIPESCKPAPGKTYVSCTEVIEGYISNFNIGVAIGIFVMAAVALIGVVLSMMLCCAITDLA